MSRIQQIRINGISLGIEEAEELRFPSAADCNSPCWWKGHRLHVLTSTGHPVLSAGRDLYHLEHMGEITYTAFRDGGRWIESVFPDEDGTLYGWYHNEPAHLIGEEYQKGRQFPLTAPMIGAVVSHDNGKTWDDLGIVLNGGPETLNLEHHNYWFAGGNGDFSVILDRRQEYFYFLFGTYYRDVAQQGISIARMRFEYRACPVGRVYKWFEGDWSQPGLLGKVTPVIPVHADWYSAAPDTFWGPSVHWNRVLQQYVILMNRAVDPRWAQDGIYISFTPDLSQPHLWTPPVKILDEKGWYPQVIGLENGDTDREAGASARLFIHGISRYILHFG